MGGKGSAASSTSHRVNFKKRLEVHPFGKAKGTELQIWKILLHNGFYKASRFFFLNGLCLLLKNPEGIRSTLEVFFFFSSPNQSPWQLNSLATADEGLKPPKAGSQEKVRLIRTLPTSNVWLSQRPGVATPEQA